MANMKGHLMSLPAELRMRIYEDVLAPTGKISLVPTPHSRLAASPAVGISLLATCQQIQREAGYLLCDQNTFCILINAHNSGWPAISETRMPQYALEQIQHLSLVLEFSDTFRAEYADVDWTPLSALTSLKTLRIAALSLHPFGPADLSLHDSNTLRQALLREVLERVPASTKIEYGTLGNSAERDLADVALQRLSRGLRAGITVGEVPGDLLQMSAESIEDMTRGCCSGGIADVYDSGYERGTRLISPSGR